jgi:hypothetical protein
LGNLQFIGDLWVYQNKSLTSLTGLESLQSIGHSVRIEKNDSLLSLIALENLQSIGGELRIQSNPLLTNLNGLESLQSIGTDFWVGANESLTSLSGLGNLQSIGSGFYIGYNDSLLSLNGIENLQTIGGLSIHGNPVLPNLSGLGNLQSIEGDFSVYHNDALNSLSGLDNLQNIEYMLNIQENHSLASLSGLENLLKVDRVTVDSNNALVSLSGLGIVDFGKYELLIIQRNHILTTCETPLVCAHLQQGGNAYIVDNAPGCNNQSEILTACTVSIDKTSTGEPAIAFSPNPASDFLQIQVSDNEKWEISLFDLRGRQMFRQSVSGSQTIGLEGWPSGLYALRAVSGGRVFAGKIVKQ